MLLNQLLTKLRMRLAAALVLFGGFMLLGHGTLSQAQSWPDKPIKLIIPFAPGGTTDILGRALAQQLTIVLKQNVIIENRAGAGGNIGAEAAAKARDGSDRRERYCCRFSESMAGRRCRVE